jgi:hypothetical protein
VALLAAAAAAALAFLILQLWKKKYPTYFGTLARFFLSGLFLSCAAAVSRSLSYVSGSLAAFSSPSCSTVSVLLFCLFFWQLVAANLVYILL